MAKDQSRRNFLKAAPLAAAVSLPLTESLFAMAAAPSARVPFQLFSADKIADAMKALQAKPGNDNLFDAKSVPMTIVMTSEKATRGKEFEYHEGRDHIFLILDGETKYDVGGTPKNARNTKPGEWLAPESEGFTAYTLRKGDMLVLPRGTPHKRTTTGSVTLILISTTGTVPA